jgi:hypothetical protein
LPANIAAVVPRGRGHRVAIDKDVQEEVINWLLTRNERGFIGEPSGWKKIKT